jgi:hypothetical protein
MHDGHLESQQISLYSLLNMLGEFQWVSFAHLHVIEVNYRPHVSLSSVTVLLIEYDKILSLDSSYWIGGILQY